MLKVRAAALIAFLMLDCAVPAHASDCTLSASLPAASGIKRGINLSRWWENDRHQALSDDQIAQLRALGFDFVRLPVSPKRIRSSDDEDRAETVHDLHCDLVSLINHNLSVVLDLHAAGGFQNALVKNPNEAVGWIEMVWGAIQPALIGLPQDRILISLYNEPQIDTDQWWEIQGRLLKDMRADFPQNTFVATAGPDGGPWNLERMKPYDDSNVIYDFHFYQPMYFTHHGANWLPENSPERDTAPINYPSKPAAPDESNANVRQYDGEGWNRDKLASFIDKIRAWAKNNRVRVACLEFGVFRPFNDAQSRAAWLGDMRQLLEAANIPWAMWEYEGNFGLIDNDGDVNADLAKALGLNAGAAQ